MADLALIKQRYKFDAERFANVPKDILEQVLEYQVHLETGDLINRIDELEQELIGNE